MLDKNSSIWNFDIKIFHKFNLTEVLLFAGGFAAIAWSVYFSLIVLFIPHQIFWNEGTAQVQTLLFQQGMNPFVLDNQPFGMNNYGMAYSLAVLPFAALFGNTLLVHRSVTFGFIIFSALAGFLTVNRVGKDKLFGLACSAFIMVGLITGQGISAFPSAMGTFLFLAAILIPFARDFDWLSLFISVVASLVAFFTKPYFVLSFGIVVSYLFLFISKKKGLSYGLFFALCFAALLTVFNYVFPLYFINTVLGNIFNSMISREHLIYQLKELFFSFLPILIVLGFVFIPDRFTGQKRGFQYLKDIFAPNISEWDKPLLACLPDYLFYSLFVSFMAFVLVLGRHAANNMYYTYQLILPLFFCWFFGKVIPRNGKNVFFVLLVLINLFVWEGKLLNPNMLKENSSEEWSELLGYMRSSERILNSPTVVSDVIALGMTPVDSGQTIFFYNILPYPDMILMPVSYEQIRLDGFRFEKLINRQIEKQKYDLVITVKDKGSFFDYGLVEEYYLQVSEITVFMSNVGEQWTMLVWRPRSQ